MIDVGTGGSLSWRIHHSRNGDEQKHHEKQRAGAFHSSLQIFD
jgi:hypothetical protein